ncbi:MAG: LptF/LptG family permease [Verrucomicrobiales bacterium]|nr:LptF/LptG family permease [Verrucomicrobiota bacterium JB025]
MNAPSRKTRNFLLILALAALGAAACLRLVPLETAAVQKQLLGFPNSDASSHQARPLILGALCFLPALAALLYSLGGTLDRYISRQFLSTFAISISALSVIWLVFDLSDNLNEFDSAQSLLPSLGTYYFTQAPAVLLLLLPYALLLSLLYSLGKLSTNREIIAMVQSGRGVVRITLPLLIAGFICSLVTVGLNYHWAPIAEGRQKEILQSASGKQVTEATKVLYRNPRNRRLWMIGAFPPNYQYGEALQTVEVTLINKDHNLSARLTASHARWNRETGDWSFENPVLAKFSPGTGDPPTYVKPKSPLVISNWKETPWQLIKPGLSASFLGIPGLNTWLAENQRQPTLADPAPYLTHWHYRWALPFTCLVTVLLATPLAIHFARRGASGGIFFAVALSALMLALSTVVLALGEAGILHPVLAAWLPNVSFALIGCYLYRRRISGKPIYRSLRRLLP